jgi:PAS domain S-box-containing protein
MSNVEEYKNLLALTEKYYNNSPVGYHSVDNKGNYLSINDTELNWLGYKREELIGKPYFEICQLEDHSLNPITLFEQMVKNGHLNNRLVVS